MERDVARQPLSVHDREEPGSIGVEGDRLEGHNALLASDPIVIAEREPTLSKFLIPTDAVKQVFERLHAVPSRRRRLSVSAHRVTFNPRLFFVACVTVHTSTSR
jgi:hypothetical protein